MHIHTRGHYFDIAETIAIVLAYEWKNWDSVSTSQVFKKNVQMEAAAAA